MRTTKSRPDFGRGSAMSHELFNTARALARLAAIHHHIRLHSEKPELHYGGYWQFCPAGSCSEAWWQLHSIGYYSKKQAATRRFRMARIYKKILKESAHTCCT